MEKIEFNNEIYYIIKGKLYDSMFIELPLCESKNVAKWYYKNKLNGSLLPKDYLTYARELKETSNYSLAIDFCLKGIELIQGGSVSKFEFPSLLSTLSSCYRLNGLPQKAISLVEQYRNDVYFNTAFLTSIASAFCDVNDYESARKYINQAYARQGGSIGYMNEISLVYKRIEKETGIKNDNLIVKVKTNTNIENVITITNRDSNKNIMQTAHYSNGRKTYLDWVNEYPNYLIIRLEGFFYVAKYDAANVIGNICNYKIGILGGVPITGSPSYDKMEEALTENGINYIIIEDNQIVQFKDFGVSNFKYENLDLRYLKDKTGKFQNYEDMLYYLESILNSVDPDTGELLDENHIINSKKFQEMLCFTRDTLSKKIKLKNNRPEKAGSKWTSEENEQLLIEYEQKMDISEIAKHHQRSQSSIMSQLIKLYPEIIENK